MHFQGELVHFFLKNEALRSESVKLLIEIVYTIQIVFSLSMFTKYITQNVPKVHNECQVHIVHFMYRTIGTKSLCAKYFECTKSNTEAVHFLFIHNMFAQRILIPTILEHVL